LGPVEHSADCSCFRCLVWSEAERRMDAGMMAEWEFPAILAEILSEIVSAHTSVDERIRRAEWLAEQLLHAAQPRPGQDIRDSVGEVIPFRRPRDVATGH